MIFYRRLHYEASILDSNPPHYIIPNHHEQHMVPLPYPSSGGGPGDASPHPGPDSPILGMGGGAPMMPTNERLVGGGAYYGGTNPMGGTMGVTTGSVPRQKGRPRKRKPKDLEAMTAGLGEYIQFTFLLIKSKHTYLCRTN